MGIWDIMRYTTFCLVRSKWLNEVQGWNRDLSHPARPRLVKGVFTKSASSPGER